MDVELLVLCIVLHSTLANIVFLLTNDQNVTTNSLVLFVSN